MSIVSKLKVSMTVDQMVRLIAKAERGELPALVTKQEIDGGKWRPLNRIEKAIMRRIQVLNRQAGGQ